MKRTSLLFAAILASASIAHAASPAGSPMVGRYQLGGTDRDGLILLDTATGRTWKYSRDARLGDQKPVWMPLQFPEQTAPAAAASTSKPDPSPEASAPAASPEKSTSPSWFTPGPYHERRPGGK